MRPLVRLLTILLLSTLASRAGAQVRAPQTVTLAEVLKRARENPPAIQGALATLRRIQAQESYARGAYIPRFTIEGGTGINYTDQPYLPVSTQRQIRQQGITAEQRRASGIPPDRIDATSQTSFGRATLDLPLVDVGRRFAVKSAHAASEAQQSAYGAAQRQAAQSAAELYLRGVSALALLDDARLTLERRSSQHGAIAELVKAGLRPSVDATRAEIEVLAARYTLETREIDVQSTGAALSAAMGSDPNQPLLPAGFDDASLPPPLEPLAASVRAIERREEVKQLEAALASRRADHQAAIGARLPTLGLMGQGNLSYNAIYQGEGFEGSTINGSGSAYLRWAALDPSIWRRANVTRGATEEAQRELEALLLSVRAEVVEAAYRVKRTRAVLEQATQILAAAEAARSAQNGRYKAGVASLLDLLDAEEIEQNARRQRIEAARDQRIARVTLLALCGSIDTLR